MNQTPETNDDNDVTGHYLLNEQMAYERVGERQREIDHVQRASLFQRSIADGRVAKVREVSDRRLAAFAVPVAGLFVAAVLVIGG